MSQLVPAFLPSTGQIRLSTVICAYRVRPQAEDEFVMLLARHWDTVHDLGFVTDDESLVFKKIDTRPTYVEIFACVAGGVPRS